MDNQCRYTIEPPKTHNGRVYMRPKRRCKRKASEHGRCWQHHDGSYYCPECVRESTDEGRS